MKEKMEVVRGSGNVFRDLGFPGEEAENLKIRTDLMIRLSKLIKARRLTQAQAGLVTGLVTAGTVVSWPMAGLLSDRLGRRRASEFLH